MATRTGARTWRTALGKRTFDVVVSALALVMTLPLWPVLALAIKVDSRGPVLYRGLRIGRYGRPFVLYKFRTMASDASTVGPGITRRGDPRVTRVGRWMRAWKLDELPNLINVLGGDMSLVGPRPEDPRYVAHYTDAQRKVLTVRPGLTSPAAVLYRHEETVLGAGGEGFEEAYVNEVLQQKLRLDLDYVERHSLVGDLAVLRDTVAALFTGVAPDR